jgi:multidrug efflux pump subunit AcrB
LYQKVKEIQNRLNRIENVAKSTLKGGKKEQFNIEVDLDKLSGFHLSMGQIVEALKSLAVTVPEVTDRTKDGKLVVFGIKNAIESVKDVKNLIIAQYMGSPIYLRDIAKVTDGENKQDHKNVELLYKDSNNQFKDISSAVTLSLSKLKGTNAVFIAEDIVKELEEISNELEKEKIGYVITRNYGERANDAVNELVFHLLISIVIIAILLIFVLGWRESIIVTFTVPAILAVTIFVAYMSGQTINRITLFAFLLSLGLLVDAAIIVIENIHRHLHSHDAVDKSMDEIMVEATDEIGAPTNIATVAIILTMVPMAFVGQMMGQFMKPIPQNVPVALFASLVIAYIFTPYLAKRLLKKPKLHHHKHHFQKDIKEEK